MSSDHVEEYSTTYVFPEADPISEVESASGTGKTPIPGPIMEPSSAEPDLQESSTPSQPKFPSKLPLTATQSLPAHTGYSSSHKGSGDERPRKKSESSSIEDEREARRKPSFSDAKVKLKGHGSTSPHVPAGLPLGGLPNPILSSISSKHSHSRSASHGGNSQIGQTRPSALKQHIRYASQGQMIEDVKVIKGHNRVPSKTEFTLPPGHVEREQKTVSATHAEFYRRGHSREASRSDSVYTLRTTKVSIKSKLYFWRRGSQEDTKFRTIIPNHCVPSNIPKDQHPNSRYPNNHIRTTKYTAISFLPKNLFEQFHRFANLYFISIVLLNWIPSINAFGKEIAMLPVMFVLGVTAIKDLFEDRRRYRSDKRINNSTCRVYRKDEGKYVRVKWKEMRVGDIVHLGCDESIPADVLILRTADPNGLCYIETSNLDGETNLKQREVIRGFVSKQDTFEPEKFTCRIEVGAPTTKIYHFNGSITHSDGSKVPVTKENLLLRDCILKNTNSVEGIIVYAGRETKAMLNNGGPRHKRTGLERLMNTEVLWCVVILAVLCLVGATGNVLWAARFDLGDEANSSQIPFFFRTEPPVVEAIASSLTFVIILQIMIPLSLYVTIELTKLMQIYHIQNDVDLYDPETQKRIECRAMNIPEDLGQIQYVFSDKTGTLTENKMIFQRCSVAGIDYGHINIPQEKASAPTTIKANEHLEKLLHARKAAAPDSLDYQAQKIHDFFMNLAVCNTVVVAKYPHHDEMNESGTIVETELEHQKVLQHSRLSPISETIDAGASSSSRDPSPLLTDHQNTMNVSLIPAGASELNLQNSEIKPKRGRLFESLPIRPLSPISSSNDTTPTESPAQRPRFLQIPPLLSRFSKTLQVNQAKTPPTPTPLELKPVFEAESPDELALVEAAYAYECKLLKRTPRNVKVFMPNEGLIEYEILHTLPFDSTRKRMSTLVKHPVTKQIILYCKGADSAILGRLKRSNSTQEDRTIEMTEHHLNTYAKDGLRILCMAKRILAEEEYLIWLKQFQEAELDPNDRDSRLAEMYNVIEADLELIGATGIEDKLQDGVPSTIESLRKAGIVVWVLTGDKQETAINIAHSCKLFSSNMDVIKLNARSKDSAERTLAFYLDQCKNIDTNPGMNGYGEPMAYNRDTLEPRRLNSIEHPPLTRKERALVVDGRTLTYILDQRTKLLGQFLTLTRYSAAVLCCRATPLQKAYIVQSVKDQLGMKTLAIGDGANDVSMIQRADVGIGISGKEGMQAVMASDFAISKFRYMERLLLVHGHWCYDRLARMTLYFFYKNAAFVFVIFWFQLLNGWSGSVMIDQMYLMVYNLFFTALPPMAIGIYDQDASADILISIPRLYRQGRLQKVHQSHSFWLNMLDALYQSIVIFFVSYGAYNESDVGLLEFGTTIVVACMFTALTHMAIEAKSWTILHVLSIAASILFFYVFAFIYNAWCQSCLGFANPYGVIQRLIGTPLHWLTILLTVVLAVLPRLSLRCLQTTVAPSDVTKVLLMRKRNVNINSEIFASWSRASSTASVAHRKRNFSWWGNAKSKRTGFGDGHGMSSASGIEA